MNRYAIRIRNLKTGAISPSVGFEIPTIKEARAWAARLRSGINHQVFVVEILKETITLVQ